MEAVALHIGIPASKVFGVATFYNQFRLNPPGRYRIAVCRGTACHVIGSATILEALESEVGLKAGQTSRDGCFSLEVVACLGACSMAPVVMVNGEFHGRLTTKMISKLVKDIRKKDSSGAQNDLATDAGGV
jgi:NADH-quinone oxidoreductase subunit E